MEASLDAQKQYEMLLEHRAEEPKFHVGLSILLFENSH